MMVQESSGDGSMILSMYWKVWGYDFFFFFSDTFFIDHIVLGHFHFHLSKGDLISSGSFEEGEESVFLERF